MSKHEISPPELLRPPDPEVLDRPRRRTFTAEYKLRIIREADSCRGPGEIGALLRREGLYSSHLSDWRRKRESGELQALTPRKTGRKRKARNPLADENARLEREKRKLQEQLRKANLIIEVQKKLSEILAQDDEEFNERRS